MLPEFICNDTYQIKKWYTESIWYFGNIDYITNGEMVIADKDLVTSTPDLPACRSLSTLLFNIITLHGTVLDVLNSYSI